ncbi:hypothetical protein [Flindersiella endophytica]
MPEEQPEDFEVVVRARRFDNGTGADVVPAYVLSDRISGHDSYRPAQLLRPPHPPVQVRVMTLDDITIVYPLEAGVILPDEWDGTLRLASKARGVRMPADLAAALAAAGVDVDGLDPAQRRHLIGFVAEARPGPTREARIAAAVQSVLP